MKPRSLVLITALLAASPLYAQDSQGRQRDPGAAAAQGGGGGQAGGGPREAAPRNDGGRREAGPTASAPASTAPPTITGRATQGEREGAAAQRRRDPGDNDRQAIPRGSRPFPQTDGRRDRDRGPVYVQPRVYNNYYYYPRRSYPYGYGAFGLGYFYYDPYVWGPSYGGYYGYDPYYDRYGYGTGSAYGYGGYPTGELRLDVRPRYAEVYVDGYFAGNVDDFDGVFQALKIEEGPHRIRIVAPNFEPLDFDVRIFAGRKVNYRGDLLPRRP